MPSSGPNVSSVGADVSDFWLDSNVVASIAKGAFNVDAVEFFSMLDSKVL
jgi:hypothetical protein